MFCSRCGTAADDAATFCSKCGAPLHSTAEPGTASPRGDAAANTGPSPARGGAAPCGGFWRRFWAFSLDRLLVGAVAFPFFGLTLIQTLRSLDLGGDPDASQLFEVAGAFFTLAAAMAALGWLYFALMESSSRQATLGKMALDLRVTDLEGRRIGFGRATARYFCKILSGLILSIGFIMAAFTRKKQALHDLIAGTLVVRGGSGA